MKTIQRFVRTSPRKLRLVADAVRKLSPGEALLHLKFTGKAAALPMYKAIKQAVSNAKDQTGLTVDKLAFKTLDVMEGPTYKRFQAVSRGMAHSIMKRTSHIRVELKEVSRGPKS
ncbi:MAG: 50S ribosomal protein L22 [bacterium]